MNAHEEMNAALTELLAEQTQLLTPVARKLYQSALTTFCSETEAQKQVIFTLLKELLSRSCPEIRHLPPERRFAFTTQLVCQLIKRVCGVEMIALSLPERAHPPIPTASSRPFSRANLILSNPT